MMNVLQSVFNIGLSILVHASHATELVEQFKAMNREARGKFVIEFHNSNCSQGKLKIDAAYEMADMLFFEANERGQFFEFEKKFMGPAIETEQAKSSKANLVLSSVRSGKSPLERVIFLFNDLGCESYDAPYEKPGSLLNSIISNIFNSNLTSPVVQTAPPPILQTHVRSIYTKDMKGFSPSHKNWLEATVGRLLDVSTGGSAALIGIDSNGIGLFSSAAHVYAMGIRNKSGVMLNERLKLRPSDVLIGSPSIQTLDVYVPELSEAALENTLGHNDFMFGLVGDQLGSKDLVDGLYAVTSTKIRPFQLKSHHDPENHLRGNSVGIAKESDAVLAIGYPKDGNQFRLPNYSVGMVLSPSLAEEYMDRMGLKKGDSSTKIRKSAAR